MCLASAPRLCLFHVVRYHVQCASRRERLVVSSVVFSIIVMMMSKG